MNAMKNEKLWTLPFITITLAFFFSASSQQMINSSFSLFVDHLGGSASFSGLTAGAFSVTAIIARALSGRIADTVSRRVVVVFGGTIYAVSVTCFIFLQSFGTLLFLRMAQGFGYAALNTAQSTIASDIVPEKRMGEGLGYFGLGLAFASAFGPQAVVTILNRGSFEGLYAITVGVILLSFFCGVISKYKEPEKAKPEGGLGAFVSSTVEKKALPAGIVGFFAYMSISMVFTFLTLYATRRGFDDYGWFFTASAATMFLTKLSTGRLCDRYGTLSVLVPCSVLGIALFSLLAVTGSEAVFILCGGLYGVYLGALVPVLNTVAVQMSPDDRRGAAVATFYIFVDVGIGLGGLVWGWVVDLLGFEAAMFAAAGSVAVSLALGLFLFRKKKEISR